MKIRFASALLALALPLVAQDPAASATEAVFYKAFYLEKGQRDFAAAMALYDQFLAQAPDHKLAGEAAKQQYGLLDRTGKTKERDAFKAKYSKLLGDVATAASPSDTDAGPGRGDRGAGRGAGGEGRTDQAARLADLEKQLAKAKEAGDDEEVKKLTQQMERLKRGQAGGGRGGILGSTKKLAEMSPEELTQFKEGVGMMDTMLDRMRERLSEEQVGKIETNLATLKTSLEGNKLEDAQKALDAIRAAMPARRGRGGEAGGGGASAGGGGGNAGGGGGR